MAVGLSHEGSIVVKQGELLFELEDIFAAVGSFEGFFDVFLRRATVGVTELGEVVGVGIAIDDGADDQEAGSSGHIAQDGGEFEIHQLQGLLHVLGVGGTVAQEVAAVADEIAQCTDLLVGEKGAAQESVGMQLLDPLAVFDVGFSSGDILDLPGIDQQHVKAMVNEDFEQRDPVDASGFHCDGGDLAVREPLGNGCEVAREGAEDANALDVPILRDSDIHFTVPDIDASGVEVDLLEGIETNNSASMMRAR